MKAGKELENYVQYVYSSLLRLNEYENTMVSKNVSIQGKTGVKHEFDVYYEFDHLNLRCRVAIECKDWKEPISLVQVRDFWGKLEDINNIMGIMVSKNGYQTGAKQFAEEKGIKLLTGAELPAVPEILSGIIQKGFLPDKKVEGMPFWTIMEVRDGEVTGTYGTIDRGKTIPLFFSKYMAEKFLISTGWKNLEVRGVSKYQFAGLLLQIEAKKVEAAIAVPPILNEVIGIDKVQFWTLPANELREQFLNLS